MYRDRTLAVVVPVYNEAKLIGRVIESMPAFVDRIIIVNDASSDNSLDIIESYRSKLPEKIIVVSHEKNQGVGGSIISGYKRFLSEGLDIAVVMAGDAQMDPDDLPSLLDPVVDGKADYTKGNRLFTGEAWKLIPRLRYLGNSLLSLLTKIASGYWHVADSQSGYTAVTKEVLHQIDLDGIYKKYGMPNDILIKLNLYNYRVKDVPIKPVYNIGEKSGIRIFSVIPRISWLLIKGFFWRLKEKYVIRNFHPLVFFYMLGILTMPVGFIFGVHLIYLRIMAGPVAATSALFAVFLFITGWQSLFFAMWMDMEDNRLI